MRHAKRINGQWYVFGENSPPAIGFLTFEPDSGLLLEIQRHRQPNLLAALNAADFEAPGTIQGLNAHGEVRCLYGCQLTHSNSSSGFDVYKIRPMHALVGANFNRFAHALFRAINFT